ncbi:peptidylprolyl isomerase, partial [Pseudomonas sp. BJa5]|nr:peptidylprolyl isomerase [Pseudomonas sp. BGr12]
KADPAAGRVTVEGIEAHYVGQAGGLMSADRGGSDCIELRKSAFFDLVKVNVDALKALFEMDVANVAVHGHAGHFVFDVND